MGTGFKCTDCSAGPGCTGRHTEEEMTEEISSGVYLLVAGIIVVLGALAFRMIF
jgi:hypothetical protein